MRSPSVVFSGSIGQIAKLLRPWNIACDGDFIWVVDVTEGNVVKIGATDGKVRAAFPVGPGADGANVWVAGHGGVLSNF